MPLKYVLQCRYFKVDSRGYVFLKARIYLTYFFYLIIFMYNVVQCKIILVFIWMRKKAIKKIRIIKKLFKNLPRKSLLTIHKSLFFSLRIFFHGHWQLLGQQGKGVDHLLFHSTTSTRSRKFRHLFATLHVRWLSHIFNRNACIYQTATRWDLPPHRITIWLIDNVMLIFICLLVYFDFRFCYSYLTWETGGLELASTIILVIQANQRTKCASHPKIMTIINHSLDPT